MYPASRTARCSTAVMPDGTQTTIRGLAKYRRRCTRWMKYRSICSAASKSAITPSLSGRIAVMLPGVRPIIFLASWPNATASCGSSVRVATTDGSFSTTPRPRTYTSVLAVPRSTAMSRPSTLFPIATPSPHWCVLGYWVPGPLFRTPPARPCIKTDITSRARRTREPPGGLTNRHPGQPSRPQQSGPLVPGHKEGPHACDRVQEFDHGYVARRTARRTGLRDRDRLARPAVPDGRPGRAARDPYPPARGSWDHQRDLVLVPRTGQRSGAAAGRQA